mgnify:FL=1|jgi:hypothetical protein
MTQKSLILKLNLIAVVVSLGISTASAETIVKMKKGLTYTASEAVNEILKPTLIQNIKYYLDNSLPSFHFTGIPAIETESADVDLGLKDSERASFIHLTLWGCGNVGCETSVVIFQGGKWKEVLKFYDSCAVKKILDSISSGLRDIVFDKCRFNAMSLFKFNGKKYILKEYKARSKSAWWPGANTKELKQKKEN